MENKINAWELLVICVWGIKLMNWMKTQKSKKRKLIEDEIWETQYEGSGTSKMTRVKDTLDDQNDEAQYRELHGQIWTMLVDATDGRLEKNR